MFWKLFCWLRGSHSDPCSMFVNYSRQADGSYVRTISVLCRTCHTEVYSEQ
jgi:hypothetical protein